MNFSRTPTLWTALLATLLLPTATGRTEEIKQRTVVGTGIATVKQKPTQMRLAVQLLAKGKTVEEALAKLKNRKQAATVQLETLKADKKSITFGEPRLFVDQSSRRQQIQAMVVAQMQSQGKKVPKGLVAPQSVTVACTLTARWPLEAESPEKLVAFIHNTQEKIKAADLAGVKEVEKAAPEQEELEEEARQIQAQYGEELQQPGQPQFLFVATLPKAEREKALAQAFATAKKRAAELAKAADTELGPLLNLNADFANGNLGSHARYSFGANGVNEILEEMSMDEAGMPSDKEDEAVDGTPTELRFRYRVSAAFLLGK